MCSRAIPSRRSRSGWIAAVLLAALMPALAAASENGQWRIERQESTWPLESAQTVEIDNPRGDVYLRTHDSDQVYLLTNTQRHEDDPRKLEVGFQRRDGVVSIAPDFADAPGTSNEEGARRRIDATVFVPRNVAVRCHTSGGRIEARGLAKPVSAESETGDISLRVAGPVRARTEHGAISTFFLSTNWSQPSALETVTGTIEAILPRGATAQVSLETHGWITTDFSVDITRDRDDGFKKATAEIGEGGDKLLLKSNRGPIRLLDSRVPAQSEESH